MEKLPILPETGFVRLNLILALFPIGKSSWWAGVKEGRFPQPYRLGPHTTACQAPATKVFDLDNDGQLRKRSAANIYEGRVKRVAIKSLEELLQLIESLPSQHALCFGVTEKEEANVLTQETLQAGSYPNAVARDRNHFSFREGQPGLMMFDCDARPGKPALNWQDIDQIIGQIIPDWLKTQRLWRASSSAFLYSSDGSELIGVGGWRCYVLVDDASSIPAVGVLCWRRRASKLH